MHIQSTLGFMKNNKNTGQSSDLKTIHYVILRFKCINISHYAIKSKHREF